MRKLSLMGLILLACLAFWLPAAPADPGGAKAEFKDCPSCPPMIPLPKDAVINAVARHELTWAEYIPAVREAQCPLPEPEYGRTYPEKNERLADAYPMTRLRPDQFDCYLGWISRKTGHRYRLPTPDEWERTARSGVQTRFPWGDEPGFGHAAVYKWFDPAQIADEKSRYDPRGLFGIYPVDSFAPNAGGLYDVIGNVGEFTSLKRRGTAQCISRLGEHRCQTYMLRGGGWGWIRQTLDDKLVGYDDVGLGAGKWSPLGASDNGFRIVRED